MSHPKTIIESVQKCKLLESLFQGAATFTANCASRSAPLNSNRGIVAFFSDATLVLEHNKRELHLPFWFALRLYIHAPYDSIDTSQNPCTSTTLLEQSMHLRRIVSALSAFNPEY